MYRGCVATDRNGDLLWRQTMACWIMGVGQRAVVGHRLNSSWPSTSVSLWLLYTGTCLWLHSNLLRFFSHWSPSCSPSGKVSSPVNCFLPCVNLHVSSVPYSANTWDHSWSQHGTRANNPIHGSIPRRLESQTNLRKMQKHIYCWWKQLHFNP